MRPLLTAAALLSLACGHRDPRRLVVRPPDPPAPVSVPAPPPVIVDERPAPPPPIARKTPEPSATVKPPRDVAAEIAQANAGLVDAYFPYDRAEITPDALDALRADAAILAPLLREFPLLEIVVEGHCDERGSAAYNLGLGARRAERAVAVLESLGIPPSRLRSISYGNERPQCTVAAESCWRRNRRAHLEARFALTPPSDLSEDGAPR